MKITWVTAIDPSGYSSCARAYIKALHKNNKCETNVLVTNVSENLNMIGIDKGEYSLISSLSISDTNKADYVVNHCVPDRMMFSFNKKNILYTMSEMEIPRRWIDICNACDLIMTASNFSKQNFVDSGVPNEKIFVIPHCHDISFWSPKVKKLNITNLKDFNFLFVGDYTPRKNGDLLIKAFLKAFQGNKNVTLTIKAYYNSFKKEDQLSLFERIKKIILNSGIPENERPNIYFYGDPIDESLFPRFMKSFDCLVSPHRAEGWGLCLSQSMALGVSVIGTRYSGNLDFMNDNNSYLVDIDGMEIVDEEMGRINSNFKGKIWSKVSEESLIDNMRRVYMNESEKNKKIANARNTICENFSEEIVSEKILSILNDKNNRI